MSSLIFCFYCFLNFAHATPVETQAATSKSFGSWYYNENGGFGIYHPDGWIIQENGRSAVLSGPEHDTAKSQVFLGSDWQSTVKTTQDLKAYLESHFAGHMLHAVTISNIEGFQFGDSVDGDIYLLRIPENIIEIDFSLRGSEAQVSEGQTALSSIDIRTKGISYP